MEGVKGVHFLVQTFLIRRIAPRFAMTCDKVYGIVDLGDPAVTLHSHHSSFEPNLGPGEHLPKPAVLSRNGFVSCHSVFNPSFPAFDLVIDRRD